MKPFSVFCVFLFYATHFIGQPKLFVQPSITSTPLGYNHKKTQFFFNDVRGIKIIDWEKMHFNTFPLPGLQLAKTSLDGKITAFGHTRENNFNIYLFENDLDDCKYFTERGILEKIHISPDNKYLVAESTSVIYLFSLSSGALLKTYKKNQGRLKSSCELGRAYLKTQS